MKVLVCGGRDYADNKFLFNILDNIHKDTPIYMIIHGDARGADTIAGQWAKNNNVIEQPYPAHWMVHGKAAGMIRNQFMLDDSQPDLVVCFDGGKGTEGMVRIALRDNFKVLDMRTKETRSVFE